MLSKKILGALLGLSLLAGCSTDPQVVIKTEYRVVKPEQSYYQCDVVNLPNPETLTDIQIAALINDLVKANKVCKNSLDAIKQYIDSAEKILEEKSNNPT